jgi:hypothetical protein
MAQRQWCDVENDLFPVVSFDIKGDRLWHARELFVSMQPHFADGYPEKPDQGWKPPARLMARVDLSDLP